MRDVHEAALQAEKATRLQAQEAEAVSAREVERLLQKEDEVLQEHSLQQERLRKLHEASLEESAQALRETQQHLEASKQQLAEERQRCTGALDAAKTENIALHAQVASHNCLHESLAEAFAAEAKTNLDAKLAELNALHAASLKAASAASATALSEAMQTAIDERAKLIEHNDTCEQRLQSMTVRIETLKHDRLRCMTRRFASCTVGRAWRTWTHYLLLQKHDAVYAEAAARIEADAASSVRLALHQEALRVKLQDVNESAAMAEHEHQLRNEVVTRLRKELEEAREDKENSLRHATAQVDQLHELARRRAAREEQLRTQLQAQTELRTHAQAEVAQLSDAHIRMQELASRRDELATIAANAEEAAAEARIEELRHQLHEAHAETVVATQQCKSYEHEIVLERQGRKQTDAAHLRLQQENAANLQLLNELTERRHELATAAAEAEAAAHSTRVEELEMHLEECHVEKQAAIARHAAAADSEMNAQAQIVLEQKKRSHAEAEILRLSDARDEMHELVSRRDKLAASAAHAEHAATEARVDELHHELHEMHAAKVLLEDQTTSYVTQLEAHQAEIDRLVSQLDKSTLSPLDMQTEAIKISKSGYLKKAELVEQSRRELGGKSVVSRRRWVLQYFEVQEGLLRWADSRSLMCKSERVFNLKGAELRVLRSKRERPNGKPGRPRVALAHAQLESTTRGSAQLAYLELEIDSDEAEAAAAEVDAWVMVLREAIDHANGILSKANKFSQQHVRPRLKRTVSPPDEAKTAASIAAQKARAAAAEKVTHMSHAAQIARAEAEEAASAAQTAKQAENARAKAEAKRFGDLVSQSPPVLTVDRKAALDSAMVLPESTIGAENALAAKRARAEADRASDQARAAMQAEMARSAAAAAQLQVELQVTSSSNLAIDLVQGRKGFGLLLDDSLKVTGAIKGSSAAAAQVPLNSHVVQVAGVAVRSKRDIVQVVTGEAGSRSRFSHASLPSAVQFVLRKPERAD
eukprot:COSAG01_NODE_7749_length_3072_cov_2.611167_1_plen_988_part_01